jgi:hypothetical protein
MLLRKNQLKTVLYAMEIVIGAKERMIADAVERQDDFSVKLYKKRSEELKSLNTSIKNHLGKR